MIGKAPFFEDAVLKLFLFVGREASRKLNHQYCDSTLLFLYSFVLQAAGANLVYCRSHAAAKFGRGNVYSSANSLKSFRSSPCALEIILSVVSSVVLPFFVYSPQCSFKEVTSVTVHSTPGHSCLLVGGQQENWTTHAVKLKLCLAKTKAFPSEILSLSEPKADC